MVASTTFYSWLLGVGVLALALLIAPPAHAQEMQLLPPVAKAVAEDVPIFPYVNQLRKLCKKDASKSFCERVAQYDSLRLVRDDYCKNEGVEDKRCADLRAEESCRSKRWQGRTCKVLRAKLRKEKQQVRESCRLKPTEPYCEGVAWRLERRKKDSKRH